MAELIEKLDEHVCVQIMRDVTVYDTDTGDFVSSLYASQYEDMETHDVIEDLLKNHFIHRGILISYMFKQFKSFLCRLSSYSYEELIMNDLFKDELKRCWIDPKIMYAIEDEIEQMRGEYQEPSYLNVYKDILNCPVIRDDDEQIEQYYCHPNMKPMTYLNQQNPYISLDVYLFLINQSYIHKDDIEMLYYMFITLHYFETPLFKNIFFNLMLSMNFMKMYSKVYYYTPQGWFSEHQETNNDIQYVKFMRLSNPRHNRVHQTLINFKPLFRTYIDEIMERLVHTNRYTSTMMKMIEQSYK